MKRYFLFWCFFSVIWQTEASVTAAGGVMAMSAAASLETLSNKKDSILSDIFAPKSGLSLEKVAISVEENMNDNGALKLHLVIVYDRVLVEELRKMSSGEYFRTVDQLLKDHPDKMKIFEWELVAKKRLIPFSDIEYPTDHMTPIAGYVFAKYSSPGEHRATIPTYSEKIKISLEKEDFTISQEK
jgi:hypothetical protein